MKDIWVKIGLVGADPQLGTLQGRVDLTSFENSTDKENYTADEIRVLLNQAIHSRIPFRLFDPIIFRAQRQQSGDIMLGALPLATTMPVIESKYLYVNPSNIMWWAFIGQSADWDQVVASTLTGLDLAGGNLKL